MQKKQKTQIRCFCFVSLFVTGEQKISFNFSKLLEFPNNNLWKENLLSSLYDLGNKKQIKLRESFNKFVYTTISVANVGQGIDGS